MGKRLQRLADRAHSRPEKSRFAAVSGDGFTALAAVVLSVAVVAAACGSREKILGADGRTGIIDVSGDGSTQTRTTAAPGKTSSGKKGASEVGVSDSAIVLGNTTSLSGAMAGQFDGTPNAAFAYLRAINEKGGWRGRKFDLKILDDALDGTQNLAQTKRLVEESKVFAFLGNGTPVQDSSTAYLDQQKVPVIGTIPATSGCQNHNVVPCFLSDSKWASAAEKYFGPQGEKIGSKVAVIWIAQQISRDQARGAKAALKRFGWDVVYEFESALTQIDFTSFVLEARRRGADFVYSVMEVFSNGRLAKAMDRQSWNAPMYGLVNYDQAFIDAVGSAADGHYGTWLSPHLTDSEAAPMAAYRETYQKYYPRARLGQFSFAGWIFARMFVELGLEKLGNDITREGLLDALYQTRDWDGDGLTLPWSVISKDREEGQRPASCVSIVKVTGGKFTMVTPKTCASPTDF